MRTTMSIPTPLSLQNVIVAFRQLARKIMKKNNNLDTLIIYGDASLRLRHLFVLIIIFTNDRLGQL